MKSYFETKGDSESGLARNLVTLHKRISSRLTSIRHIIAISSAKDGVGKSTFTVQLALSLSSEGKAVSILDADFNGPTIATITGISERFSLSGPAGVIIPKTEDGIGVLSVGRTNRKHQPLHAAATPEDDFSVTKAKHEFSALADLLSMTDWGELDYLLIDLPAGPERASQFAEFFGAQLDLVFVTLPPDVSGEGIARSIASVGNVENRVLGYVENMRGYLCPDSGELKPLFPVEHSYSPGVPRLGEIPFEPMLARLCEHGLCAESWSMLDCTSYVKEVADNIVATLEPTAIRPYTRM